VPHGFQLKLNPATCAKRELEVEIGMTAYVLARLVTVYTTPGFTDEKIHLFLAHELKKGAHRHEPDEFMEVHTRRWSEVMNMMRTGEILDAKTMLDLIFVQGFRR
jgi:ADP-ribose pyrophosphatase